MIHYEILRQKLTKIRIDKNMSQTDVATRMGIAVGSFHGLENGTRVNPTTETLHNWCRALECRLMIDIEPYEEIF